MCYAAQVRPVGRGLRTRRATMNSSAGTPTLQEHVAAPSPAPKRPRTSRPAFTAYRSPGYSLRTPANARVQGLGALSRSLRCEICQRPSPLRSGCGSNASFRLRLYRTVDRDVHIAIVRLTIVPNRSPATVGRRWPQGKRPRSTMPDVQSLFACGLSSRVRARSVPTICSYRFYPPSGSCRHDRRHKRHSLRR